MTKDYFLYGTLLVAVCIKQGILQSDIVLSLSKEIVPENTNATLTCSKATGSLVSAKWITSMEGKSSAACGRSGDTCLKFGFLTKNDIYDCICNDQTIAVLLKNVDRYQHGATWRCADLHSASNTVVINVSVPVTRAVLHEYSNDTLYENSWATFVCNTSNSLPSALISWYMYLCNGSTGVEMINKTDLDVHIKSDYYKGADNLISTVETLRYKVNKSDHGCSVYCNASNLENISVMSNEISLSIKYKASVTTFSIEGYEEQTIVLINESENVQLHCNIDSKPGSTIALYFQGKHEIHRLHNVKNLSYLQENVTCFQAGLYTCSANNEYNNGYTSIKILFLQVKCSPRRAEGPILTTVNAPAKGSATFSFTALAYPEPGPSGFKWHKLIGSTWVMLNPSEKNGISSSELTSTLTITSLTESDYGNYMLRIENSIGVYKEIFHLMISEEEYPENVEESNTLVISIVIGCIVIILVVTIVSVLFIIIRRRRCETMKTKGKNGEGSTGITKCRPFKDISEIASITEEETSFTNKTVYEEIKPDKDRVEIERMEKTYEQLGPDKDELTSTVPVYTNLAL